MYRDHERNKDRLQYTRNREMDVIKSMHSTRYTNEKSRDLCKYYTPIWKRVDEEMERRKGRMQRLKEQVEMEREEKDRNESDQLWFPRTELSYEVQSKRNYRHTGDEILSWREMFNNFLRDHQAWDFRKKAKIEKQVEEKVVKEMSDATFTPNIDGHSRILALGREDKIEWRLIKQGIEYENRLIQMQKSQKLSFKPWIYSKTRSRWRSTCSQRNIESFVQVNSSIPSLPPRPDFKKKNQKVKFQTNKRMLYFDSSNKRNQLKEFSPIMTGLDSTFNTLPVNST